MPETRRDLFKTSVLSALGGLVVGAAAAAGGGYAALRGAGSPRPLDLALANSVVAVFDQGNKCWYFFLFSAPPPPLTCTVWVTGTGISFPLLGPTAGPSQNNAVDTNSWFQSLKAKLQVKTAGPTNLSIQYNATGGGSGTIAGTVDASGNLQSLGSLLAAVVDMQQYPGSWNEIGKQ